MSNFQARTLKRKNVKGLALSSAATARPPPPSTSHDPNNNNNNNNNASTSTGTGTGTTDGAAAGGGAGAGVVVNGKDVTMTEELEIGLEFKLDLKSEDLIVLKDLGAGNGGSVSKVMHASTKVIMARKVIRVDAKENVRKQIVRELQVGHDCKSPYIVTFYGAFQNEARDIVLCMEYMDCGSLDSIAKEFGPIRVDVLGKITESILGGLVYLYEVHRIMHRDIKPSNVLVNSRGSIKLCDFGVAGETVNSIADTFVGTSTYMAPERIQGGRYTVRSDVWSVGLTIMELAVGKFPFDYSDNSCDKDSGSNGGSGGSGSAPGPMGILDLLQQIVHEPAPKLPKSDAFPKILDDFIAKCLLKKPEERPTPRELYDHDLFLKAAKRTPVDLRGWAIEMMNKKNRKSYLNPPAPRSIQGLGKAAATAGHASTQSTSSIASITNASPSHSPSPSSSTTTPVSLSSATNSGSAPSLSSRGPPGLPPKHTHTPHARSIGGPGGHVSAGSVNMTLGKTGRPSQVHVVQHRATGSASAAGAMQRDRDAAIVAGSVVVGRQQGQQQRGAPQRDRDRDVPDWVYQQQRQHHNQMLRSQPQTQSQTGAVETAFEGLSIDNDETGTTVRGGNTASRTQTPTPEGGGMAARNVLSATTLTSPQIPPPPAITATTTTATARRSRSSSLRQAIANIGLCAASGGDGDDVAGPGRPMPRRQYSSTAATGNAASSSGLSRTLLDYDTQAPAITTPTHVFTEAHDHHDGHHGHQGSVGGVRMGSSPPFLTFTSRSQTQPPPSHSQQSSHRHPLSLDTNTTTRTASPPLAPTNNNNNLLSPASQSISTASTPSTYHPASSSVSSSPFPPQQAFGGGGGGGSRPASPAAGASTTAARGLPVQTSSFAASRSLGGAKHIPAPLRKGSGDGGWI